MEYDIYVGIFGTKFYHKKGSPKYHREDGPAIERLKGEERYWFAIKYNIKSEALEDEWWVNGFRLPPEKEAILNKWYINKG